MWLRVYKSISNKSWLKVHCERAKSEAFVNRMNTFHCLSCSSVAHIWLIWLSVGLCWGKETKRKCMCACVEYEPHILVNFLTNNFTVVLMTPNPLLFPFLDDCMYSQYALDAVIQCKNTPAGAHSQRVTLTVTVYVCLCASVKDACKDNVNKLKNCWYSLLTNT